MSKAHPGHPSNQQPDQRKPPYLSPPDAYYPSQTPVPPIQPAPPPRKRMARSSKLAIGFLVLLIAAFVLIVVIAEAQPGAPLVDQNATATTQAANVAEQDATANAQLSSDLTEQANMPTAVPTLPPSPQPTFTTFGDGMYQVGKDIQPGTYRTREGSSNCYYARLKSFDTQNIISNNNTDAPAVVTIYKTDTAFQSEGCGTWTSDLSQITTSKTSFSDGIYIVGTDIAPGTYKNTASTNCYYARLSAFDTQAIISNNNTDAVAIVTIYASDKGFQTEHCGTWTKI